MTATEILREEVIHYVEHADDRSLRIVKAILAKEEKGDSPVESEDWWDDLPKDMQDLIEKGLVESEAGEGISHEEMMEKYSKWFKR